ncbi:MAG TPA: hypothetical protein VEH04_10000 [Verrucomicrobiae bacterium]|nr:hypothetical protein [Verrucomicrobiae bacterium]
MDSEVVVPAIPDLHRFRASIQSPSHQAHSGSAIPTAAYFQGLNSATGLPHIESKQSDD